ncbi:MAG: flagellin hook IN motif-containing protein, partial [Pseudomonadales bacterium]
MSLVINTNIASITAQRALQGTGDELASAMERLATGSKINSSADDAAGLAIGQRMTAQVNGLNMAVKNAGDGMAMTQTIESALNTISDMLQRMRELAVQSVNATNSSRDRSFLQQEVNQLTQEINRVSATSQFNGEKILDGTFVNKTIQLGMEEGERLSISVPSIAADEIGAYTYTGNGTAAAAAAATPAANAVTVAEDLTIVGPLGTAKTSAAAGDSAKQTVNKINALSSETGVSATAQTYLTLSSTGASASYAIKINGVSSGNFTISNTSVEDAVRAINSVAGSTGVTATSTADGKVLMFDNDGDDITIENDAAGTDLKVQKMDYSGTETVGTAISLATTGSTDSTRVSGAIKAVSSDPFTIEQAGTGAGNVAAEKTTTDVKATVGTGNFSITLANTGETITVAVAAATAAGWQAAIDATSLVGQITATIDGNDKVVLTGVPTLGDFTLIDPAGNNEGVATTGGTEGTGIGYFETGTATLSKVSDISIATQAGAGLAISVADAALDTVARMRANLGAIDNRLSYTMDNLINVS